MMHVLKLPGLKPVKINDTNFTPSALNNPLRNKIIQSTVQGRPADIQAFGQCSERAWKLKLQAAILLLRLGKQKSRQTVIGCSPGKAVNSGIQKTDSPREIRNIILRNTDILAEDIL